MNHPPAFFKVFIAEICDKDLEIPLSFIESLSQSLPEKVCLRDRHGKKWTVGVGRIGDSWHFLDGWTKFSRENFLTSCDLLIFEYYREGHFSVVMYGTDATEKNIVPFTVPRHDDSAPEVNVAGAGGAGKRRRTNQKKEKWDCYGADIFRAGLAQQPENPYFVTKLQKREGELFVPMEVIKSFNLEFPKEMKLVDPIGREFMGKCKTWSNGRTLISGGWRSLCRMNLVAEDDRCICEFVRRKHTRARPRLMKVSFVRYNANLLGSSVEK